MIRLFIALKIPDEIKEQIVTLRKSVLESPEKLRWEPAEKFHITLKFIGDVPEDQVDEIANSLDFISSYKKFKCNFSGFAFFFSHGRPKFLSAGFSTDYNLIELADRLNKHMVQYSVPAETRKFIAHLTLLRIKDKIGKDFIEKFDSFRFNGIPFIADEAALIKSELKPAGSVFTEIKNFKLG
jgi:RNA 2',3'-cyclic 3'-phosphodiesterase